MPAKKTPEVIAAEEKLILAYTGEDHALARLNDQQSIINELASRLSLKDQALKIFKEELAEKETKLKADKESLEAAKKEAAKTTEAAKKIIEKIKIDEKDHQIVSAEKIVADVYNGQPILRAAKENEDKVKDFTSSIAELEKRIENKKTEIAEKEKNVLKTKQELDKEQKSVDKLKNGMVKDATNAANHAFQELVAAMNKAGLDTKNLERESYAARKDKDHLRRDSTVSVDDPINLLRRDSTATYKTGDPQDPSRRNSTSSSIVINPEDLAAVTNLGRELNSAGVSKSSGSAPKTVANLGNKVDGPSR